MTLDHSPTPRILSIQSHVVSGYCGNKSAVFPLQLLEFEVDIINTVQLSNHTQYETTKGQIFTGNDVEQIHEGLKANKLLPLYDFVLSGYVADVSYVMSMATLINDVKKERSRKGLSCLYTFDPVLGDDGVGYYIPNAEKVVEAYKRYLIPLADVITPNRFEASILSGVEINGKSEDAIAQSMSAINVFHQMGVRIVVITSMEIIGTSSEGKKLTCIVSKKSESSCSGSESNDVWIVRIPKLNQPFTGTGDLFAALFTGWLHKTRYDLRKSLENTANSIQSILEDTLQYYNSVDDGLIQSLELRLVQNKRSILEPATRLLAENISDS